MKLFYCRVSTEQQNEERQIKAAADLGIEKENIFIDKQSGKNTERKELKRMLSFCRKGDIVYCESISRIARNTKDLLNIIDELNKKQVDFVSLKESIDTSTPQGKFVLTVFGALAELERDCILQRQAEGIQIAKEQGKYKGRKKIDYPSNWDDVYIRWKHREITGTAAMNELNMRLKDYQGEGWRMFAFMKKVISDNNFDFTKAMSKVYNK